MIRVSLIKRSQWAALELPEGEDPSQLPTAFRIFAAGVNESTKGSVLFDAEAAEAVMSAWQAWGVDIMIDLNHESLEPALRPDSADARGWARLAVQDGELWAVDVRWTEDGAERLRSKKQRYISPAFTHDAEEPYRVRELINVAIVAMPATLGAPALMAASRVDYRAAARVVAARARAASFLKSAQTRK